MKELTRRKVLSASAVCGVVGAAGCLSGSDDEPPDDVIEAADGELPQIKRREKYFLVEVPRDDEPTRRALRLANQIEHDGGTTTTSDQWSKNTGGDEWNFWIYGDFSQGEIEDYLDDYGLDLSVGVIERIPRRSAIIQKDPISDTGEYYRRGGEYQTRYEIWEELPDILRPLELPDMSVGRNSLTLHNEVSDAKLDYLTQLVERSGHLNLIADGKGIQTQSTLTPGWLITPDSRDHMIPDSSELEFTEMSHKTESSQMWRQHWHPEWEQDTTMIRIESKPRSQLHQLVEWHQNEFDETPTTITLRLGDQRVASERLESLVENPEDPDSYAEVDEGGWTPLPRVSADIAGLVAVYLQAPYEIDLGATIEQYPNNT